MSTAAVKNTQFERKTILFHVKYKRQKKIFKNSHREVVILLFTILVMMFEDKAQKSVDIGMMDPLGLERDLKNEPGLLHSYGSKT